MNIAALLARTAAHSPDAPAVLTGDRPVATYGRWADRAARLAATLRAPADSGGHGLRPGDRVALFMTNSPDYLVALFGVLWAGLTVVPVNAKLHPRELAYVLDHSGAALLLVSPDLAATLPPGPCPAVSTGTPAWAGLFSAAPLAVQHRDGGDTAWLFYTSGTTGTPKGVMITHRNLMIMTLSYASDVDPVDPADATVYAAPMSHGAGLYTFASVLAGARHVVPPSGGFDPAELCALSQSVGRLALFAAPTMVRRLVEHIRTAQADPSGFKTIVYGGGPMYGADLEQAITVMGDRFVQIYGQGECPMTITVLPRRVLADRSHPRRAARLASVGFAQSPVEVAVCAPDGRFLPPGETGDVVVRGDVVMAGYWNAPDATAAAIRDGWLWTGDIGSLDADGFLTLKDRSKDVIISGGSNIYPREVEEVLLCHPLVTEVAVIGRPDPDWGETVTAFVVGTAPVAELDALCLDRIARFKRPKDYRFVDALPKNNYGKVLKTALRQSL
ncbi:class I adenylate-forming enzyme family protein [Novispirillum itersonii]|uniref:class I adenylate-forming enzyme family protein n=1 Tax=Novispirillum itersonii TaxID=189 RepID=UPI00035DDD50|nr:AMP-binding protein [Novispirillum itersonii]